MKKVLILSDTHMPKKGAELPETLRTVLNEGVDCIIHAGDWCEKLVYDELSNYAPVHGVKGNIEKDDWAKNLPDRLIVKVEHLKIGIVHGNLGKGRTTPDRAFRSFEEDNVDIIVFGHSHIPLSEIRGDVHLFNPGSPTDKRRQQDFSYGILIVDENQYLIEHRYFSQ